MNAISMVLLTLVAICTLSLLPTSEAQTYPFTVNYNTRIDNTTLITNPGRGFYCHVEGHSNSFYPLDAYALNYYCKSKSLTVILRLYYLFDFKTGDISADFLTKIRNDLAAIQSAELMVILRFAYSNGATVPDAPLSVIQSQITQLTSIFADYKDIILTVQAGFIGAWGEWYYSTNNLNNPTSRAAVTASLLAAVPYPIQIQVRTPAYKQAMYGTTPTSMTDFTSTNSKSRVGHHNDCFLASDTDQGTYSNVVADKQYISDDAKFVIVGGETCAQSTYSNCANALQDLAKLRYTFLNRDYNTAVLNDWITQGCMNTVTNFLGYRLSATSASVTVTKVSSTSLHDVSVSLSLQNFGYAAPIPKQTIQFIFRNTATGAATTINVVSDSRFWYPYTSITLTTSVAARLSYGTYSVEVKIANSNPTLSNAAGYNIRLANTNMWSTTSFTNLLFNLQLSSGTPVVS